tara:strand:- start:1482 stop:2615 length:1134 start_codon:yes stop_codon:yes gene_type:complete
VKVALFLTYDYSLDTWYESGTLKRELEIYKKIKKDYAINFLFITYGNEVDNEYKDYFKEFEIIPIYSLIKKSSNSFLRFIKSFLIPFKIKKYLNEVDIIQQHQLLGSWVSLITKFLVNKPLIIRTGYDMYTFSIMEKKKKYITAAYKFLTFITTKFCNLYTVASKSDYKLIKKYFKDKEKIVLRPNWVHVNNGDKKFNNRHRNKILSVGRLVEQKNFELLIREFKNTENFLTIDIVGKGPEKKYLSNLANKLNVKINFLGNLEHEELLKLYDKYNFFVSSSVFEGNPKTILEAMGSGCIVIASDIPNHKELIENNETGILFDLLKPNLLNTFNMLKEKQKLRYSIQNNAVNKIKKSNSIDLIAKLSFEDYQNIRTKY